MTTPFAYLGPGVRTHGRLVNAAGSMSLLTACGHTPCDAARFSARLVKRAADAPTYLFCSECRRPNDKTLHPTYSPLAGYPDPGVPTVVRCTAGPAAWDPCFVRLCNDFDLIWDGSQYAGYSIPLASGSIPITITPAYTAGVVTSWHFNWTGSCAPGGATCFINCAISCAYPLTAGGNAPLGAIPSTCCGGAVDPNTSYYCNIYGCTPNRYLGRLVAMRGTTPVYEVAECCAPSICSQPGVTCCGCAAVPANWRFTVAGITTGTGCVGSCLAFNGTWTLAYGVAPCGSCCWAIPSSEATGACSPGSPWTLRCDGTNWILATQSMTGGVIDYALPLASWKCFGPNTMPLRNTSTTCVTPPATVTLAAV